MHINSKNMYSQIPGKGLLCSSKIPDTLLFGAKPLEFGAEGLLLSPTEPMKKWKVIYNEKMWFVKKISIIKNSIVVKLTYIVLQVSE